MSSDVIEMCELMQDRFIRQMIREHDSAKTELFAHSCARRLVLFMSLDLRGGGGWGGREEGVREFSSVDSDHARIISPSARPHEATAFASMHPHVTNASSSHALAVLNKLSAPLIYGNTDISRVGGERERERAGHQCVSVQMSFASIACGKSIFFADPDTKLDEKLESTTQCVF